MDANSPRIMTLDHRVNIGESHAPTTPSYPRPREGLPPRRRAPTNTLAVPGLQEESLGPAPLVVVAGRRGPHHFLVRRLPAPPRRPISRDGAQGPVVDPARLHRAATATQCRAGRAPAQDVAQAPPAVGHRLDVDPLPWPAVPRPRRDLPRP